MNSVAEREAAIVHMAESEEWIAALRQHVHEIVEGEAFRGSSRCSRFLSYIVDQAIAGRFESLKERVIGLELFERPPAYDTSEDAIVRVTASDVRKRLLQHYGKYGAASEFRINLPLGSYIPEIIHEPKGQPSQSVTWSAHQTPQAASQPAVTIHQDVIEPPRTTQEHDAAILPETVLSSGRARYRWLPLATLLILLNLALWAIAWAHFSRTQSAASTPVSVIPWSALFNPLHPTHLVTSDPDLAGIERLTGSQVSVSDYANHNYLPEHNTLTPQVKAICLNLMRGDKSATVDTQIGVNIAELAKSNTKKIEVQGARNLQFSNLKTDDNFIFLGSPYTDPWFSVFNDQLDFRILMDPQTREEVIRNVHPRPQEQLTFVPTARGGATGQSFAVIAFVGNPDQYGQVLLLAGLNSEGTQAAGRLVSDLPRLSAALQNCGISPSGPLKHFEMILRVNTMAGSPSQFDVLACHILPAAPSAS